MVAPFVPRNPLEKAGDRVEPPVSCDNEKHGNKTHMFYVVFMDKTYLTWVNGKEQYVCTLNLDVKPG